jgi:hypothetical protein
MKEKKMIPKSIKNFAAYFLTLIFCRSNSRKEIIRSYELLVNPKPKIITVAVTPINENQAKADEDANKNKPDVEVTYLNADKLDATFLSLLNNFFAAIFITSFFLLNFLVLIIVPAVNPANS